MFFEMIKLCKENPNFIGLIITDLKTNKRTRTMIFDNGSMITSCYYMDGKLRELLNKYNHRIIIDKNIKEDLDLNVYDYILCDSCNGFLYGECRNCNRDRNKVLIKGEIIRY